jgi:hypothetical protein
VQQCGLTTVADLWHKGWRVYAHRMIVYVNCVASLLVKCLSTLRSIGSAVRCLTFKNLALRHSPTRQHILQSPSEFMFHVSNHTLLKSSRCTTLVVRRTSPLHLICATSLNGTTNTKVTPFSAILDSCNMPTAPSSLRSNSLLWWLLSHEATCCCFAGWSVR